MNLADAIRKAAERPSGSEGSSQAWISLADPPQCVAQAPQAASREVAESTPQPPISDPAPVQEEVQPQEAPGTYYPEPPTVTAGNVVRLELFLNSEQMTGLLKAILAGQHSVLTLKEAAAYLRVSPGSVQEMAEQGEIPGVLVNGAWRFPKSSLDEWMTLSAVRRLGSQLEDAENVA